ncbi:acetoacetate--CoA ligase [Dethiobacter alkaliphilus]|uniref:Acetoacetyl-CoA synthase n=1 Tax=Dethiobacter alkaliphilus AHT 1 TaxID=555088 RepID=C0GIS2_DETAL|nr:acetoacetate--CoA ligase [Dethiobacter alkaliphilus]EEG76736.1 acetoacetyl-CoA synthase [Dethiobacter alkaliphilus AHT 1]
MKQPLWKPSPERKEQTNMTDFMRLVNDRFGKNFSEYDELYAWSVENIEDFWALMWEYGGIVASKPYDRVVDNLDDMFNSEWFPGARLNFAENLLRFRDDRTAMVFKGEADEQRRISYRELYDMVARLAKSLREHGVGIGDRVAGFMPNMIETVAAMLAASSIGAIWSSCSPDFGFQGVMDRFGQIQPKVLFAANGYSYNGKKFDSLEKVSEITKSIPEVEKVVIVPYTESNPDLGGIRGAVMLDDFLAKEQGLEIEFTQLPFEHPLYIMYSSGTTGVPKCIVHGAGGTLIQHLKELILHTDLSREDTIFYFTTCGWMMWNWLVSSLAVGATVVLFDGSPFYPEPGALFKLAMDEEITVFGTSAKYISAAEQFGVKPRENYDLEPLKAILSTGSPLSVDSFHYVYRDIKEDLCLSSISGGTDIISCFALGNPNGPVYSGELQCRGLGMKVEAYDLEGKPVVGEKGELVCTAAFPSMPIYFWNDEDDKKYLGAYFETYPGIWHHGDYVEVTENGGMIFYGRSDATLNPGGVRIGTAEIYRQVEAMPQVADSLVVGQEWDNDVRVVLFVKLEDGTELSEDLIKEIKTNIRKNATPRHVPERIIQITDIPYTINGKKVEIAVKRVIHGEDVPNKDALANPEALDLYKDIPELSA